MLRRQSPPFEISRSTTDHVCNPLQAKRNKDVGMGLGYFLSLGGHSLVPFLFHKITSLHPPHFREMIFPLVPLIQTINPSIFAVYSKITGIGSITQCNLYNCQKVLIKVR